MVEKMVNILIRWVKGRQQWLVLTETDIKGRKLMVTRQEFFEDCEFFNILFPGLSKIGDNKKTITIRDGWGKETNGKTSI